VALGGCQSAADDCLVDIDGDTTTLAAALLALAAGAGLVALLGVRFTSLKAGGVELTYEAKTEGLPTVEPSRLDTLDEVAAKDLARPETLPTAAPAPPAGQREGGDDTDGAGREGRDVEQPAESPVKVDVRTGLGTELGIVPVAVPSLSAPMNQSQARFLRDYQSALRIRQKGWFLTHILGPAKSLGQKYSVAIKVTPHPRAATGELRSTRFYFGRAWGHQVFEGSRGTDGRFGITTEAYGPFLALCEVEFTTGERVLFDHYCDFEMGALVASQ
jgi:hypothetical protein